MGVNFFKDIKDNSKSIKELKEEFEKHIEKHIVDDLQKETFPGSGRPLYTYEHIAERNDTNPTHVCRVAKNHGISRRSNNSA